MRLYRLCLLYGKMNNNSVLAIMAGSIVMSRPLFDDDVVRWSIDTTSQGIQFDSLNALQAWLTKIPTLRVIDLTLSGIT